MSFWNAIKGAATGFVASGFNPLGALAGGVAGGLKKGSKKPGAAPAAGAAPGEDIYLGNPELRSAVAASGARGTAAEDDFLSRARAFDPQQGLNDYATGATNDFFERFKLAQGDLRSQGAEKMRTNTGFFSEDQNRLSGEMRDDFLNKMLMRSQEAQQLGLQNQSMLGQFGQAKSDTYLDALSGLTTSKRQQDLTNEASKRDAKGNLIGGALGAVGSFLGSPTGGKVLSAAGNALKGIFTSDEEAKEGIEGLRSALDKLKQLEGVMFEYNNQAQGMGAPPGQQAGVIAQDVEQVMPEAVGEAGGMKTVDYTAVTGLLTEAVKELEARLMALEGKMGGEEEMEGAIPTPEMAASQMQPPMGPPGMDQMMPPGMAMSDRRAKKNIRQMVRV